MHKREVKSAASKQRKELCDIESVVTLERNLGIANYKTERKLAKTITLSAKSKANVFINLNKLFKCQNSTKYST